MKKYLITPADNFEELFIVNAINQEKAIEIFSDFYALKDEIFHEALHDKCVNMGFAEKFWFETTEESDHFMKSGECLATEKQFKNRVKKYFGVHKEWAKLFIDYYFAKFEDVEGYKFPDEMIKFLWIKNIDWLDLHVICLDEVEEINPISTSNDRRSFNYSPIICFNWHLKWIVTMNHAL